MCFIFCGWFAATNTPPPAKCYPRAMWRYTAQESIAALILFSCSVGIHFYFCNEKLDLANFLRYDDHMNFNRGIGALQSYNESFSQSLRRIWVPKSNAVILKVFEPVSTSLKMFVANLHSNSRLAHVYTTIALHSLSVLVLFFAAIDFTLLLSASEKSSTKAHAVGRSLTGTAAFAMCLLFTVSPNRVEVIAWASACGYAHALFFTSLSMWGYIRWRESNDTQQTWYFLHLFGYLCGILSKAVAIPAVALPVLLDFAIDNYSNSELKLELRWSETIKRQVNRRFFLVILTCLGIGLTIWADRQHEQAGTEFFHDDLPTWPTVESKRQFKIQARPPLATFLKRAAEATQFYFTESLLIPLSRRCIHYFYLDDVSPNITTTNNTPCFVTLGPGDSLISHIALITGVFTGTWFVPRSMWMVALAMLAMFSPAILMAALEAHSGTVHIRYVNMAEGLVKIPVATLLFVKCASRWGNMRIGVGGIVLAILVLQIGSLEREYHRWHSTEVLWTDALSVNENDDFALHSLAEKLSVDCVEGQCDPTNLKMAREYMSRSLRIKPSISGLYNMAVMEWQSQRPAQAAHYLKLFVEQKPLDAEAHVRLIEACSASLDEECIHGHAQVAFQLSPQLVPTMAAQALKAVRDPKKVSMIFNVAVKYAAEGGDVFFQVGLSAHLQQLYEVAAKLYHDGIEYVQAKYPSTFAAKPYWHPMLIHQGEVLKSLKDYAAAKASFQTCLRTDPKNKDALYGVGIILFKERKYSDAASYLEQAIDVAPNDVGALWSLGNAILSTGQNLEKAKSCFHRVGELDPGLMPKVQAVLARYFSPLQTSN